MEYKRIKRDINGNPRYVFHYSDFNSEKERDLYPTNVSPIFKVNDNLDKRYELALSKARSIGGKKYRGKDFGRGIVIQSYNIKRTIEQIEEIKKN